MKLSDAAKIADYHKRGWWDDATIDDIFRRQVAAQPAALALIDPPIARRLMVAHRSA